MKHLFKSLILLSFIWFTSCESPTDSEPKTHVQIDSLHYLAIGASDAIGIGAEPQTNGYVYLIRDELNGFVTNLEFTNLGISGQVVSEINASQLDQTIAEEPDLISIWTGGNDFNQIMDDYLRDDSVDTKWFEDALDTLITTLTSELPETEIVIGNLPDMTKLPIFDEYSDDVKKTGGDVINTLNTLIKAEVDEHPQVRIANLNSSSFINNPDNISDDDFHPSNAGYYVMKNLYMVQINQLYAYE